ncbi:hypothetical protein ABZ615_11485 [Streptomyces sp. NPDC007325]|uniref:hypothetical protein n=1 Tax=Streptomyces sp. NPDC007325 TaxID=3154588 RepID=UPI0033FD29DC
MREEDVKPEVIVDLLGSTWDELLGEIYGAVSGGWLARHLEEVGDAGDAEVVMEEPTLDEAVAALAQAVENTSPHGEPSRNQWHRTNVHAALQAAVDLVHQAMLTASALRIDPVPRSTAAHALLAGGVFQLRQAAAARDFWHYERTH